MAKKRKLDEFRPAGRNANRHTQRGLGMLDDSMARDGYLTPLTVAADGEAIDGSARLETVAMRFPDVEPLVVEHDGTRPVVMVRKDIPTAHDPRARRLALAANRIAELDLDWDVEIVAAEVRDPDLELPADYWRDDELEAMVAAAGDDVLDTSSPEPRGEPELRADVVVELLCTRAGFAAIGELLRQAKAVDGVEVQIV